MTNAHPPRKLSQPTPRRVEARAIVYAKVGLGLFLAVVGPIVLTWGSLGQARVDHALALRGEVATGTFEKLVRTQRIRNSPNYYDSPRYYEIRYAFRPSVNDGPNPVEGEAWVTEGFYQGLSDNPEIVVRYDSAHPEVSSPVYAGMEQARWPELKTMIVWSAVFDVAALAYLAGLPILKLRRDGRLLRWGVATRAKIVSKSVGTGRSGNFLSLNYEFVDAAGKIHGGSRIFWEGISASGHSSHPEIRAALDAPTVLYDPGDSGRHLLYPSPVATIRR